MELMDFTSNFRKMLGISVVLEKDENWEKKKASVRSGVSKPGMYIDNCCFAYWILNV